MVRNYGVTRHSLITDFPSAVLNPNFSLAGETFSWVLMFKEQQMPAHGKYKSAAVVAATKIPIETFNRWLDHKVCGADDEAPGKGHPRRFSLDCIYKVAIGHMLTNVSVPPTKAMALAQKFIEPQRGRDLGRPFDSGKTLMLITDGVGKIINLHPDHDISSYLQEATIVVDLGKIVATVNSRILN